MIGEIENTLHAFGVNEEILIIQECDRVYALAADGQQCAWIDPEDSEARLMNLFLYLSPDATHEESLAAVWEAINAGRLAAV